MAITPKIQIACLASAASLGITDPHRYFVISPVKPGPQPAVIEVTKKDPKRTEFFDAFIVLPEIASNSEQSNHPVYSACMRVIQKDYRPLMSRALKDKKVKEWQTKNWDEPPFSSPAQREMRGSVYTLIRSLHLGGEELERLIGELKTRANWYPQHLQERDSERLSAEHWRVLRNWEQWESRQWDWQKRYEEFESADYGTLSAKERINGRERLRKLCGWMGLTKIASSSLRSWDRISRNLAKR